MKYDPKAPVWNIMTRTRGGTVSLLKNLTEEEARGCMQRLRRPLDDGDPWSDRSLQRRARVAVVAETQPGRGVISPSSGWHTCSDGDLEKIDCWGPPGVKLEVWPKPADADERYERFVAEERERGKAAA